MADAPSQEKAPIIVRFGTMIFAGFAGGLIVAMAIIAASYWKMYPTAPVGAKTSFYVAHDISSSDENKLKLLVKEVVEKETERAETRLRDHFTLLIALSGIAITTIIGVFSFVQSRREDRLLREINEKRDELNKIQNESRVIFESIRSRKTSVDNMADMIRLQLNNMQQNEGLELSGKITIKNDISLQEEKLKNAACESKCFFLNENLHDTLTEKGNSVIPSSENIARETSTDTKEKFIVQTQRSGEHDNLSPQAAPQPMKEASSSETDRKLEAYQADAERGDAQAQLALAQMYKNGQGVPKNDELAFEWFMKAAEQGDAQAQYEVAHMYKNGLGTPKNLELTFEWFHRAAVQDHALAQFYLGLMYDAGYGVPQNKELAVEWFMKADENGAPDARFVLEMCFECNRGAPFDALALEWYQKLAEQGDVGAQNKLGMAYLIGSRVQKNRKLAFEWFEKAAKQGLDQAQFFVGYLLKNQPDFSELDEKKVAHWFKLAADQGHTAALLQMAKRYFNGKGVPENYVKAYAYILVYKASAKSDEETESLIESFKKVLTPEQIIEAQKEAEVLWKKFSNKDSK